MDEKFPLGLPPGSVRATLTIFTHVAVLVGLMRGVPVPPEVIHVWMGMNAVYFGGRLFESNPPVPKK